MNSLTAFEIYFLLLSNRLKLALMFLFHRIKVNWNYLAFIGKHFDGTYSAVVIIINHEWYNSPSRLSVNINPWPIRGIMQQTIEGSPSSTKSVSQKSFVGS